MKNLLLLLIGFTLIACHQDQKNAKKLPAEKHTAKINLKSLSGNWTLVCFSFFSNDNECKPQAEQKFPISLVFTDDGITGKISGYTTSNNMYGKYKLFDKCKIKVEEFGGTQVGELNKWGKNIWGAMNQASSYSYSKNADTLIILYNNDTKSMKFVETINKQKK
jgi:hypothetical protein